MTIIRSNRVRECVWKVSVSSSYSHQSQTGRALVSLQVYSLIFSCPMREEKKRTREHTRALLSFMWLR